MLILAASNKVAPVCSSKLYTGPRLVKNISCGFTLTDVKPLVREANNGEQNNG